MTLIDDILVDIGNYDIEDIAIGHRYISAIVTIDGVRSLGMAYVFNHLPRPYLPNIEEIISSGKGHELLRSNYHLEASIGLAITNAVVNSTPKMGPYKICDSFLYIEDRIKRCESVAFIGYFKPLIDRYREILTARRYYVFETRDIEGTLPMQMEDKILPKCDFVIISASAIVNHTIDHILTLCNGDCIVIGPSLPITPIFFDYGANAIAGVKVLDIDRVHDIIKNGGGRWEVDPYLRFVCYTYNRMAV